MANGQGLFSSEGGPWWAKLADVAIRQGAGWVILAFMVWWLTHSMSANLNALAGKFDEHAVAMQKLYEQIKADSAAEESDRSTTIRLQNLMCGYSARNIEERQLCNDVVSISKADPAASGS